MTWTTWEEARNYIKTRSPIDEEWIGKIDKLNEIINSKRVEQDKFDHSADHVNWMNYWLSGKWNNSFKPTAKIIKEREIKDITEEELMNLLNGEEK